MEGRREGENSREGKREGRNKRYKQKQDGRYEYEVSTIWDTIVNSCPRGGERREGVGYRKYRKKG